MSVQDIFLIGGRELNPWGHFLKGTPRCGDNASRVAQASTSTLATLTTGRPGEPPHTTTTLHIMPSIKIHPTSSKSAETATSTASPFPAPNPLPQLLQTPSGLAILELQATINLPALEKEDDRYASPHSPSISKGATFETPVGKLMFPDYSPQDPDDTKWMKRAYLFVGRYQRMTGEVKKLPKPLAVLRKRSSSANNEELEVVEIIRYKAFFKSRPEPVNDI